MTANPSDELIDGFRTITATLAAANRSQPRSSDDPAWSDGVNQTIPVTILTGFLGSGKTTVLRHLLGADHGLRLTALVNDLAAINVDARSLSGTEPEGGSMIDGGLSNGCACCQLGEQLTESLLAAADAEPGPDAIIVEASGGADVVAMAAAVEAEPGFALDGIVGVVDAVAFIEQVAHPTLGPLIRRQLEAAHLVLASKIDLIDDRTFASVVERVALLVPGRRVIGTALGVVDPSIALGAAMRGAGFRPPADAHRPRFLTRSISLREPVDPAALAGWLESDHGLLRGKGWVRDGSGRTHELQLVGRRWTLEQADDANEPVLALIADDPGALDDAEAAILASARQAPSPAAARSKF